MSITDCNNGELTDCSPALLLFAKPAILGETKTRLHAGLVKKFGKEKGDQLTQRLAEAFLKDIAETFAGGSFARFVAYTSQPEHPSFQPLRDASFQFIAQSGQDLGERLKHAISRVITEYKGSPLLIIGSDTPYLRLESTLEVISLFSEQDRSIGECPNGDPTSTAIDLVIGPAEDGGYYFIAMKKLYPELFDGIEWGTSVVYEQTIGQAESLGLRVKTLPVLRDIDEIEDLEYLHSASLLRGNTAAVMQSCWWSK